MGQGMLPDCGIKLVSWYQHSPARKHCIIISRVSLTRISIKCYALVNPAKFTVCYHLIKKRICKFIESVLELLKYLKMTAKIFRKCSF